MRRYFFSLLCLPFFLSCEERERVGLQEYLELADSNIRSAIVEYQRFLYKDRAKQIAQGDSAYVGVYAKDINDSIKRYVLYPIINIESLSFYVPVMVSNVNGHAVFFTAQAYLPYNFTNKAVFTMSQDNEKLMAKKYFPRKYKIKHEGGNTSREDYAIEIYEPQLCFITYINDSLIDKTYSWGLVRDNIAFGKNREREHSLKR